MAAVSRIPANGVPFPFTALLHSFVGFIFKGQGRKEFTEKFCEYTGVPHGLAVGSGRSALFLILQALRSKAPHKNKVLIPAVTCESVFYAVRKAELQPVFYEIDKRTFGPDVNSIRDKIDTGTLCVVAGGLFGIPVNLDPVKAAAREAGCYLVEDAAQTLGASWKGNRAGTCGDFSFFSFGKSKVITTLSGGMICTGSNELYHTLTTQERLLSPVGSLGSFGNMIKLFFYWLLLKPFWWGIITRIKNIPIFDNVSPDFPLTYLGNFQGALGIYMLQIVDKINKSRKIAAKKWLRSSFMNNYFTFFNKTDTVDVKVIYLRLPALVRNASDKVKIQKKLLRTGIWSKASMYHYLPNLFSGSDHRNEKMEKFCANIIILPTHPGMKNIHI